MSTTYNIRTTFHQRRLVPNLMRTIIYMLEDGHRPMSDTEIISSLGARYRRADPEFQRQVRMHLGDGVSYGILRRQNDHYSLRSKRLAEILATIPSGHPGNQ
ncbi:uncharacterized protein LOC108150845 [Drosophila miranda]|uniref:uncharacterized protein LOC108150845 n=1 Tax=Drosophila miranda TaxID=7229 RepID=UPI0007E8779A|nr:uncharacterized protein LOC108150845 [Drosophila miranda]